MPRRKTSTILLDNIVETLWERVLKDEKIYRHEVIPMLIQCGSLSSDHVDKINDQDKIIRFFFKAKEDRAFTALNKQFQILKYFRFESAQTDGTAIRLDFINDGIWQERKVVALPQKTLRQVEYRIGIMNKQDGFMNDKRLEVMKKVTNATQIWKHNVESEILPYLQTKQPDPKPMAQAKPKAKPKLKAIPKQRATRKRA